MHTCVDCSLFHNFVDYLQNRLIPDSCAPLNSADNWKFTVFIKLYTFLFMEIIIMHTYKFWKVLFYQLRILTRSIKISLC